MNDDFMYHEKKDGSYKSIVQLDGVRTTICTNRFEISVSPHCEVWEQHAVQQLKEWIKWRKAQEELRNAGDLPI